MYSQNKTIEIARIDGTKGVVVVGRLTIDQLYRAAEMMAQSRSTELVCLATGLTGEEVNALSDESFGLLSEEVVNANFTRALKLSAKDKLLAVRLAPLMRALSDSLEALAGQTSTSSSAAPSPPSGGPGAKPPATPSPSSSAASPSATETSLQRRSGAWETSTAPLPAGQPTPSGPAA